MMNPTRESSLDVDAAVRERYSKGALERQESLCCPVPVGPSKDDHVPAEVIEKDYGCGDPSAYIRAGDAVLDLGSGAGRICFVAARLAGPEGSVIGVDMNDDMLAVANKYVTEVGERLGYENVSFRKGKIQDLQLDCQLARDELLRRPVGTLEDLARFEAFTQRQMERHPMIGSDSVDLVVSNCVLNLVPDDEKPGLFREIHRVLRRGGRIAISDIVCDETPSPEMKNDPELWSGCLSGALREEQFVRELERAGFYGISVDQRAEEPWQVVNGIEFRSVTLTAWKGKEGPCLERRQAVIYKGPWKQVEDDDGHVLRRGDRMAVCHKTFKILTSEPYSGQVVGVEPHVAVPLEEAGTFTCAGPGALRDPRETKLGWIPPQREDEGSCC